MQDSQQSSHLMCPIPSHLSRRFLHFGRGSASVSVVFANLGPNQSVYISLDRTAGKEWNWCSTR
jgi:hypothetical protein